jgi:hypothetical protein
VRQRILVVDEGRRSAGIGEGVITALVEAGSAASPARAWCGADTYTPLAGAHPLFGPSARGRESPVGWRLRLGHGADRRALGRHCRAGRRLRPAVALHRPSHGRAGEVVQHVTVPSPLVAAGNGIATGMEEQEGWRTYHWRAKHPNTYAIALNIGPYELLQGEYRSRYGNTIPLRFWHLKGNTTKARACSPNSRRCWTSSRR